MICLLDYPDILSTNIYDIIFKDKFLLVGSCIPRIYPDVLKNFEKEWGNICVYCLEQSHYNMLFSKLVDILALGKTTKVGFLTVDGSPHCIQMHFASKYLKRALKNQDIEYKNFVINKNKQVFDVPVEKIDYAKDLSNFGVEVVK